MRGAEDHTEVNLFQATGALQRCVSGPAQPGAILAKAGGFGMSWGGPGGVRVSWEVWEVV